MEQPRLELVRERRVLEATPLRVVQHGNRADGRAVTPVPTGGLMPLVRVVFEDTQPDSAVRVERITVEDTPQRLGDTRLVEHGGLLAHDAAAAHVADHELPR